ncbi:MAG: hypothetical protein LQ343_008043, partial [Gyalolechia ehrenbergii]
RLRHLHNPHQNPKPRLQKPRHNLRNPRLHPLVHRRGQRRHPLRLWAFSQETNPAALEKLQGKVATIIIITIEQRSWWSWPSSKELLEEEGKTGGQLVREESKDVDEKGEW